MIKVINFNRKDLVPQAKNKRIEEIQIEDFKIAMQKIAEAEIIDFTCNLENKVKTLKHRWSTWEIGEIRELLEL